MAAIEKQFAWAEVMAIGKGFFHDFPVAIGKTTVTFNRFGLVAIGNIYWVRWKIGKGKEQKYSKKQHHPTFEALSHWPLTVRTEEPRYRAKELSKISWEQRTYREKQRSLWAQGRRKKLHRRQQKILNEALQSYEANIESDFRRALAKDD